jgi:hypothetical protein
MPEAEVLPPVTDIITVVFDQPQIALTDKAKGDAFLAAVRAETQKLVADVATTKGRDEIRSMAAKVTRSKTLVDKARLSLTADLRQQVSDINEAGKRITGSLDALADEVRKPLTDWEDMEKLREARVAETIAWLKQAAVVTITDTADVVRERGMAVFNHEITKDEFGKRYQEAIDLQDLAVSTLKAAMERLEQEEADRAELARLRKADEERAAREAAERAERERAAQEAEEAQAAFDRQAAAEQAERDRIAKAEQEAADRAARAAQEAAQREIDAANARAAEAEERERQRLAQEQAEAAEQARRERNRAHRAQVMAEIKLAIMAAGNITEEQAVPIVKAMVAGSVARVKVEF